VAADGGGRGQERGMGDVCTAIIHVTVRNRARNAKKTHTHMHTILEFTAPLKNHNEKKERNCYASEKVTFCAVGVVPVFICRLHFTVIVIFIADVVIVLLVFFVLVVLSVTNAIFSLVEW
jgi:hypothetical protein